MKGFKEVLWGSAAILALSGAASANDWDTTYDTSATQLGTESFAAPLAGEGAGGENGWDDLIVAFELKAGWVSADADDDDEEDSIDFDDDSYPMIEGQASVSAPLGNGNVRWQADINGFATFTERDVDDEEEGSGGEDNVQTYFGATGQLNYIDPDETYSIGVLGHVGSSNGGEDENATFALGAVQGQWNANEQWSVFGQAGYFSADDETEMDVITDAYVVRGGVSFYPDENKRVRLDLQYMSGEENDSSGDDVDAFVGSLRGDMAINDGPWRAFAEYRYAKVENDGSNNEYTENAFFVGFSVALGAPDIRTQDIVMPHNVPAIGLVTASTLEIAD